jgi:hypothetical protein
VSCFSVFACTTSVTAAMRLGYRFHDAVAVEAADVVAPDDEDVGFLVGSRCYTGLAGKQELAGRIPVFSTCCRFIAFPSFSTSPRRSISESFSVLPCMTLSPAAPSGFWFDAVRTAPPLA